jgi:hypothetical protein
LKHRSPLLCVVFLKYGKHAQDRERRRRAQGAGNETLATCAGSAATRGQSFGWGKTIPGVFLSGMFWRWSSSRLPKSDIV